MVTSGFPGDASARLISVEADGVRALENGPWQTLFDLSLDASGESWTGIADLLSVARFGHFTEGEAPWEKLKFASDWNRTAA